VFVVEFDLGHLEEASPLGLVQQTILERPAPSSSVIQSSIASGS
jgi:hypothetical protein